MKASERLLLSSLLASNREREETLLKEELTAILPDISDQYMVQGLGERGSFDEQKARCLHCFQISLAMRALEQIAADRPSKRLSVVDVGDSSGNHLIALKKLMERRGVSLDTLSLNIDPAAVEKIRSRGLKALLCNVATAPENEDSADADLVICFQVLEHVEDPLGFLRGIRVRFPQALLFITVPFLRRSQVGLYHLRGTSVKRATPESTHVFELSSDDWSMIFAHAGWKIRSDEVYLQYPRRGLMRLTKPLWRRWDFEGFYGAFLDKRPDGTAAPGPVLDKRNGSLKT